MTTDTAREIRELPSDDSEPLDPEMAQLLKDLVGVGRMWAHYGLTIGRMALDSSARTLSVGSDALDKLARRVEPAEDA